MFFKNWCLIHLFKAIKYIPISQIMNVYRKEGNVLFKDALNTFYLRLYGVRHMVKDHQIAREETIPPHGLLFPISNKGYFICTIPQTA